jgi:hypothetical protein
MREDMAKVIVHRPRHGGRRTRKGRVQGLDLQRTQIGLRRAVKETGDWKTLNENLAPLRRFLEGQVGRPWNKVYAEICARLRVTSTVQQHVRDHLKDFVRFHPVQDRWVRPDLYVDPRDGLLKRVRPAASKRKPAPLVERIPLSEQAELRLIAGLWFEVTLARLPDPEYVPVRRRTFVAFALQEQSTLRSDETATRQLVTPGCYDVVTGEAALAGPELDEPRAWTLFRKANPTRTYAVAKRQLSARELRRHGLKNMQNP